MSARRRCGSCIPRDRKLAVCHRQCLCAFGLRFAVLLWDNGFDATAGEHAPVDTAGVGPVCQYRLWSCAWPSGTAAGHADVVEDLGEHCAVVTLPTGHHHRQWAAVGVDGRVNLGGQSTAGTPDPMTCWLAITTQRARGKTVRQFRVIRPCPLCPDRVGPCLLRAGAPG